VTTRYAIFDLDGTLLDSDEALLAPFLSMGVPLDAIGFGRPYTEECRRLGIDPADYVAAYDTEVVLAFPGVDELLTALGRYSLCSNKATASGQAELARLGWTPEVARFADSFVGGAKALGPLLDDLGMVGEQVLYVGDTPHDRAVAHEVGATFALAGWNPRARAEPGDIVLTAPSEVLSWVEE
jgi:phosphoglycolate phosphatase-like HAD superfamily hydrolase